MTARIAVKALVVVALAAPLVGGLVGSRPAEANGTITSPKSGTTFSGVTVDIEATAGPTQTDLTLTDPVSKPAKPVVVASYPASFMGTGRLSYHLNTACWTHLKCTGSVPAPNGDWTVVVTGATGADAGAGGASQTFTLKVPPRVPAAFTARASGARQIAFTWTKGTEPDLTSYTLYDGAGKVARALPAADACTGSSCSYVLTYPADAPGRHDFALTSYRRTAPTGTGTVESSKAVAGATLAAPASRSRLTGAPGSPADAKAPVPSAQGKSPAPPAPPVQLPAGDNGSSRALGQTLAEFAPNLAAAGLPPLPLTAGPTLAEPPLPFGTFKPALPYKPVLAQPPARPPYALQKASNAVHTAPDTGQLVRSLAGALVLLLAGAHLRRLVSRSE